MRFHAIACDYDGTLAWGGRVDEPTIAALERVRASGRKLLLVTGRQLEDLASIFTRLDLFDRAVLENGALVHDPSSGAIRALAPPPTPAFVEALAARGVDRVAVGRAVVATWKPRETEIIEVIRDLGLELQLTFNKDAVMVLPSGINKAAGLRAALAELGLSPHNTVAIGDAENDHAFFDLCELSVAVSNSIPSLAERADWVTAGDHGAGVRELVEQLLADDLRALGQKIGRHALVLGETQEGAPVTVGTYTAPILIAGSSGAGKSTLATSLLEQLAEAGYQYGIVDPEGDHLAPEGVIPLGDAQRSPQVAEILEVLAQPGRDVAANLLALPLADRPTFCSSLLARVFELRARTGRPHWLVIDEAHHLLPSGLDAGALALPSEPHGMLLLTVHPESVAMPILDRVGTLVVVGSTPRETFAAFAAAAGTMDFDIDPAPLPPGEALVWSRSERPGLAPVLVKVRPPSAERRRHVRKYAAGELGPDISFYFRGPENRLNLRAQNLQVFLQLGEGVDDETWSFHLARNDYSRWFRERIKDEELAAEAELIENDRGLAPAESRARLRKAVETRYTAPA